MRSHSLLALCSPLVCNLSPSLFLPLLPPSLPPPATSLPPSSYPCYLPPSFPFFLPLSFPVLSLSLTHSVPSSFLFLLPSTPSCPILPLSVPPSFHFFTPFLYLFIYSSVSFSTSSLMHLTSPIHVCTCIYTHRQSIQTTDNTVHWYIHIILL